MKNGNRHLFIALFGVSFLFGGAFLIHSSILSAATVKTEAVPTVTISAVPTLVSRGGSVTLSWTSTNATSCVGVNFTLNSLSGAVVIKPMSSTTYRITCKSGGGKASQAVSVTVSVPRNKVKWKKQPNIKGVTGSYTPLVITGPNQISVYANNNGAAVNLNKLASGALYVRTGTFSSVGEAKQVISQSQITDQTGTPYIRTSAVVRGVSGKYYAVLHIGDSYPFSTGYVPSWATSDDGLVWNYQGKFKIDGDYPYNFSSSASLIVQEDKPPTLDMANPANNRFLVWEDSYNIEGVYKKMALVYSADGIDWHFYRDASGKVIDVWPNNILSTASDTPVFPSTVKTPFGYHMIAANKWPATAQRHLWSCNGLTWNVIEDEADTFVPEYYKGTNLSYDPSTNLIHSLTGGPDSKTGMNWSYPAKAFPCP